jgi:hypothetical protein
MSQLATVATAATSTKAQAPKPRAQPKIQPNSGGNGRQPKRTPAESDQPPSQAKKAPGRSSQPIINWFQRKLAGTVKHNRRGPDSGRDGQTRSNGGTLRAKTRVGPSGSRTARAASSPFPQPTLLTPPRINRAESGSAVARRKTISLDGDDDGQTRSVHSDDGGRSTPRSSLARESTWSPTSNLEADEDASVRPLPPSAPPSPSPSLSASSYLSDPHTFRSMAASTKPTTLLSVDLAPNGMAHIAQAPTTPVTSFPRFPHVRNSSAGTTGGLVGSGASITFSALPPSPQSSRPSSLNYINPNAANPGGHVQAPLHTAHHPRNNPRPSSPPQDNASMLTLASSAFAVPGTRMGVGIHGWNPSGPSPMGGDSISHFGGSIIGDGEGDMSSQYILGDDGRLDVDGDRDVDASIRALRPRSSRRGSWGSEASDWSAQVGSTDVGTSTGTPSRSVWTTNSNRTGGQLSVDNGGPNETLEGNESVDNPVDHPPEHTTPISSADPLPVADDNAQHSAGKVSLPKGEITPKKKEASLTPSLQESSAGVPLPEGQRTAF